MGLQLVQLLQGMQDVALLIRTNSLIGQDWQVILRNCPGEHCENASFMARMRKMMWTVDESFIFIIIYFNIAASFIVIIHSVNQTPTK